MPMFLNISPMLYYIQTYPDVILYTTLKWVRLLSSVDKKYLQLFYQLIEKNFFLFFFDFFYKNG